MSISKSILVIGAFLLVSLPAFAQFGQVDGYVLGPDKKPVLGAVVAFDRLDSKRAHRSRAGPISKGYYHDRHAEGWRLFHHRYGGWSISRQA